MCQLLGLSSSDPIQLTFNWESFAMRDSQQGVTRTVGASPTMKA